MANETKITDIVGKEAFEQLERLDKKLADTQNIYIGLVKEIGKGLTINPSNLTELNSKVEGYRKNVSSLKSSIDDINNINTKYKQAIDDLIELNKKQSESIKQVQINVDQSTNSLNKESNAIVENIKNKQQDVVISRELKELIDLTLGTREENIKRVAQEKTALAQLSREKTSLNKLEKSGAISTQDAVKRRQELIGSEMLHRESLRGLLNILTNETNIINSSNDSYQKQSLQLERLRIAYKLLEADVASGKLGVELQKNISILDAQVKITDKSLGQFHRNVGNYPSKWDGLGNSIAQLTREFPAFAVSLQTGFLAISNNIPILADEISRIRKENAALRDEGLKTVPVWKQVAKSVLSWNTLLSVGITLLTVYGKDIFEWGKNLLSASNSANAAADAQKDLTSSTGDYAKALKNLTSSYGDNLVTLRSLQTEWESLGGNLDKQKQFIIDNSSEFRKLDVSVKDVNDAENLLVTNTDAFIEAMSLRAQAAAGQKLAQEEYSKALQKTIDADNKLKEAEEAEKNRTVDAAHKIGASIDEFFGMNRDWDKLSDQYVESLRKEAEASQKEADAFNAAGDVYLNYVSKRINGAKEIMENSGIDDYSNKEKLKRQQEQIEREAKRREKLEMEAERNIQESRLNVMDEGYNKDRLLLEQSFQKRIDDVKTKGVRVNEQIEAIETERSKALFEFDRKLSERIASEEARNRLAIAEKGSLKELDAKIDILELQREQELREADKTGQDKALIEKKYLKQIEDIYNDYWKRLMSTEQSNNELYLSQRQMEINDELVLLTQQYQKGLIKKEKYEKEKSNLEHKFAVESLQSQLSILESNLDLFEGDERLEKEKEIARLKVQLSKETSDKIIKDAKKELDERKKVEEAKKQLIQEAASAIASIGNSLFHRQIDNIDAEIEANEKEYDAKIETIDALAEKNFISSEEAEARKRSAEEQTAAKNKELEKKKADLQTRQAKFQKAIDIAQSISATSLAVTKALPNLVLASLVGSIGALQLATIMAQPIPKYAHGTDHHPGGLAIVGDAGKNEAILLQNKAYITPNKPTLLSIPEGAEVIPDLRDPAFLKRFVDNTYWLTHNKKGEPVQIVNNFDAEGIISANNEIKNEIRLLSKAIKKNRKDSGLEMYKNFKMK